MALRVESRIDNVSSGTSKHQPETRMDISPTYQTTSSNTSSSSHHYGMEMSTPPREYFRPSPLSISTPSSHSHLMLDTTTPPSTPLRGSSSRLDSQYTAKLRQQYSPHYNNNQHGNSSQSPHHSFSPSKKRHHGTRDFQSNINNPALFQTPERGRIFGGPHNISSSPSYGTPTHNSCGMSPLSSSGLGIRRVVNLGSGGGSSFASSHELSSLAASPGRGSSSLSPSCFLDNADDCKENSQIGYTDRFIPSRVSSNLDYRTHQMGGSSNSFHSDGQTGNGSSNNSNNNDDDTNRNDRTRDGGGMNMNDTSASNHNRNMLLRSELLSPIAEPQSPRMISSTSSSPRNHGISNSNSSGSSTLPRTPLRDGGNMFRFQTQRSRRNTNEEMFYNENNSCPNNAVLGTHSIVKSFNICPVGSTSHRLLSSPQKQNRRIAKVPFKVLDAPALQDDFYLNLVDWSSQNVLAVGLGSCVYLWSAFTSKVTKLCDLAESDDSVTSVSWTKKGSHLAVGTNRGEVHIWDTVKCQQVRTMGGHSARIGTLAWNGPLLASGSRDRIIYLRDARVQRPFTARLSAHKQEVCGLKWSCDEPLHLASGGNDNKLLVWDIKKHNEPVNRFSEHTAAIKAIAWSPHQRGLLASGGGTADRCIRFWNTLNEEKPVVSCVDTGSQVCNLAWSSNCNEVVSTHGYSLNQIVVWKYPSMTKVATLTGHTYRVLYLAVSPDGSTIVTGAGDETLRFWQVFPGPRSSDKNPGHDLLFPQSPGSVVR
eukprot:CAMPEP_0194367690 /NCGR_PEP_ID=MMETSP0174-20130528/15823_1 /TAXON_ID=216777 /ORGANISM="Proboscia alata, Strain PI-D3" /LENGTH=761 /DNA_ID=CAMNT_0039143619 /DNA_START=157 /DNA_END=2442 /DNA_ORIENTATION=+